MKKEVDTPAKVLDWIDRPEPAIFQGQDLRASSQVISTKPLTDCVFLGCSMEAVLAQAAAAARCLVMPGDPNLPFDPYKASVYTPAELYDRFNPADPYDSYRLCLDWKIYDSFIDPMTKVQRPVDVDVVLFRRLHDASIGEALDDLLDEVSREKCVAIMGGHDRDRDDKGIFLEVAKLGLALARAGRTVVTGGGPGLMEAANLGAYAAGFTNPETIIATALTALKAAPKYSDKDWLKVGYQTWKAMGSPANDLASRNIGIPTWFYGHEPPNLFATHIAKYFENSVREEGLLALASGGVIFAEGNGGTVQEIFQDANQNYYRTYGKYKSPMVLLDTDQWSPATLNFNNAKRDRRKPAYQLLHKLATEKAFDDYVLLTSNLEDVVPFLTAHPPAP